MGSSKKRPSTSSNNVGCLGIMAGLCLAGMVLGLVISLAVVLLVVAFFAGLVALSVYFWKTDSFQLSKKKKVFVLVACWVFVLSFTVQIAMSGVNTDSSASSVASSAESSVSSSVAASSEAASSEGAASEADSAPEASSEAASAPASSVEQAASSEAAAVVPAEPSSEAASEAQAVMVWIPTHGGTKYHRFSTCSGMEDPEQVTLEEAEAMGFTPCGRCY